VALLQNNQVLPTSGRWLVTLLQSKQPSPRSVGWGPFFNQNNQVLGKKKSKPGAMIVLFFSKQPSPSYFRPVVGDPSSIKTTKSLIKKNPNLEQNPIPN
jgi:hypothetical protein